MSVDEAKEVMMTRLQDDMKMEMATYIKNEQERAKSEVDKKAKELLVQSIQRCATDHTSEATATMNSLKKLIGPVSYRFAYTDNIRNAVENDVFGSLPDDLLLDELESLRINIHFIQKKLCDT